MRDGIDRRIADPIPIAILSLLHHFPDLRRGSNFPGAVRSGVHGAAVRRLRCNPRFSAASFGRAGLGVEQRVPGLGANQKGRMSEGIDEGLRSELQKRGVWVTSTQELYNWG